MSQHTSIPPRVAPLLALPTVRARSAALLRASTSSSQPSPLQYWKVDLSALPTVVEFCASLIKRDYPSGPSSIPPHSRWRHFCSPGEGGKAGRDRLQELVDKWMDEGVEATEISRRCVDLVVVSVLLDAGAGDKWRYVERGQEGVGVGRSEGLAIASVDMFKQGLFSTDPKGQPYRVDATALRALTPSIISTSLQVSPSNPLTGLAGRASLLVRLGEVLSLPSSSPYFSPLPISTNSDARPGNLIDHLLSHPAVVPIPSPTRPLLSVPLAPLWETLLIGLGPVWPREGRHEIESWSLGDCWPCPALEKVVGSNGQGEEGWTPFHKLTQWLCYSLVEVLERTAGVRIDGKGDLTGLPEYRNGGLFIDFSVLLPVLSSFPSPSLPLLSQPPLPASHPAIVEMRALTVGLLDVLAEKVSDELGLGEGERLELAQVLEAASWKGGREVARMKRAESGGGPPINIELDGTIF